MDISKLKPGDEHYMAFVGPVNRYDFMGATQFRLLCTLGLRANHFLLDFGCGSLRAGKLFIPYLDEGRYFGVEPNKWLIEEAINHQIGQDLIRIKSPLFDDNNEFRVDIFHVQFDFILAQSIFSHTGAELIRKALGNFAQVLKKSGIIAATFVEGGKNFTGNGWIYPDIVRYRASTINEFAEESGLFSVRIPWFHPGQTWYLLAKDRQRLPSRRMSRHLTGAVLFDPEFRVSVQSPRKIFRYGKAFMRRVLFKK